MSAFAKALTIGVAGLVLITPTASARSQADLTLTFWLSPPQIAVRESLFSTAFVVKNTGRRTAPSSRAALFLSKNKQRDANDFKLGETPVRRLSPRRTSLRAMTVRVPKEAEGEYFLLFCADVDRQVRESNERNCRPSSGLSVVRGT